MGAVGPGVRTLGRRYLTANHQDQKKTIKIDIFFIFGIFYPDYYIIMFMACPLSLG